MSLPLLGTFDLAIAGAGPAGSALGLQLARQGARVALFDPASFPRDKLCGEYLSPESVPVLDRLGLAGVLAAASPQEVRQLWITTPRGRSVTARADAHHPPGIGLSRSVLDDLLVRAARAVGAHVFERTRVSAPLLRDGRVAGLVVRHPALGLATVEARVTVAACGRSSVLVRQTGRTRVRDRLRGRYFGLKRHLSIPGADDDGTVGLHVVPGGYGGLCGVGGGLTNFCALLPESSVRSCRGDLDRVAREVLGRNPVLDRLLASSVPAGPWKTVAGVRVEVSTPRVPGILYAGDAQGTVDPLAGQGMTMALTGAELLAPFVAQSLTAGPGADTALQLAVQAAWHDRFDHRVRLCALLHHALIHPSFIDLASHTLGTLAPRLLRACYRQTRGPVWMAG